MPLIEKRVVSSADSAPDLQTQGYPVPPDADTLYATVSEPVGLTDYTVAAYALIDDEVPVLDSEGKVQSPPVTRSSYGPDPFIATEWPEMDNTRRTKTGTAHFAVPLNKAVRRVFFGVVDLDGTSVTLRLKWGSS